MPRPAEFHRRLDGMKAIVTGAGGEGDGIGIGAAISTLMAKEGAQVAIVDIDEGRARTTCDAIASAGGSAGIIIGDVSSKADAKGIVDASIEYLGKLDILVNNVGIGAAPGPLDQVDPAAIERVFKTNFSSAILMSRFCVPYLRQGRGKAIVNIASIAGLQAYGNSAYGPSKAALLQLTREIAVMYGRDGIRANAVVPGHMLTPMVEAHLHGDGKRIRREIAPLGIDGDAWDIAQAALFLASSEARFITGAALPVDGGVSCIGPMAAFDLLNG